MPDTKIKVVRNTSNKPCSRCGGIHDYLSRVPKEGRDCSTPVAFSYQRAVVMARSLGQTEDTVVDAPHDTVVVMDDSARKLPREEPVILAQLTQSEVLA